MKAADGDGILQQTGTDKISRNIASTDHILSKFCVGGDMKFKIFDFIEFKIKIAID